MARFDRFAALAVAVVVVFITGAAPPTPATPVPALPAPVATTTSPEKAPDKAATPAPATTPEKAPVAKKLVAVLDLKPGPGAEAVATGLTTVLTAEIGALDGYKAISRNELKSIVAHQAAATMAGCESVNCMADIAKLVDAQLVVAGSVDRVNDAYVLSMTLVDPAGPSILERQQTAWRGPVEEMLGLVRPTVDKLFSGPNGAGHAGNIEIFAPDGANLVVDGKDMGAAPLKAPLRNVLTGAHVLEVQKDGYEPYRKDLVVSYGDTTVVRVDLTEEPFTSQWWFWTATGGAVVVAGGAAALITTLAVTDQKKSTTIVLVP